jgi:hypothetical protein
MKGSGFLHCFEETVEPTRHNVYSISQAWNLNGPKPPSITTRITLTTFQNLYILLTQCIYPYRVTVTINTDYFIRFLILEMKTDFLSAEERYFLNNLDELQCPSVWQVLPDEY